jgi:hypothetical protein
MKPPAPFYGVATRNMAEPRPRNRSDAARARRRAKAKAKKMGLTLKGYLRRYGSD